MTINPWSGLETARAKQMHDRGMSHAEIAAELGRSRQAVQSRLTSTRSFWSRQEPTIEPPDPAVEAEMLSKIRADGGFPRVEVIDGRPAWVWPHRRAQPPLRLAQAGDGPATKETMHGR